MLIIGASGRQTILSHVSALSICDATSVGVHVHVVVVVTILTRVVTGTIWVLLQTDHWKLFCVRLVASA